MTTRIVFLDRASVPETITIRRPSFTHDWIDHSGTEPNEIAARAADADILIVNKVALSAATLAALPKLRLIAVAATGTNMIDLEACERQGVVVTNVRRYAGNTVPEHTFALMLALRRSIAPYRASVIDGRWQRASAFCYFDYPIHDLAGSTLGIIGDGFLGQAVAEIGRAFRMRVVYAAYKGTTGMGPLYTPFDEVIATSDVISLHCPLNAATRNLIALPELRRMKRTAILINTARGGLVNEADLAEALDEGLIAGAGFDVVTEEPPPAEHVMMRLARRDNVILTPHVAWASHEAIQGLCDQMIDNIEAFMAGAPVNLC